MSADAERRPPGASVAPWLALAAFVFTIAMNAAAVLLPLAGRSTGEISARYPVSITPAGFTFGIWSVIYLVLGFFVVYQALPRGRRDGRLAGVRGPFIASCLLNGAWLVAWHNLYVVASLGLMLALAASLVVAYRRIDRAVRATGGGLLLRVPFAIYLAWIAVASVVNARVVLYVLGWTGGDRVEEVVTVLAVAALAALAMWMVARRRDAAFGMVVAWALVGIRAANPDSQVLPLAAGLAAVAVASAAVWEIGRRFTRSSRR